MKRRYAVYGKESAQMTDSESNETLLTHWEGLIDVPEQVWRWVATPGYLVAETPWQVLRIEPSGWDSFFARLLNQELGVPPGWTLEWEPGACVVSRIAHVGPGLDALLLDGFLSRWCIDYLSGQLERGYSIAFRGGGRACRWIARAIGAQWPLAYETRGRGLPLDPRLLVWEGESLPAAADLTILSYDEFNQAQLRGTPLIIDQVGRRVPREVATVVDVRRDGRVIRVQERRGRDWKTLFKNVSAEDAEALEPVSLPHDDDYWSSNGQSDWWSSLRDVFSKPDYPQTDESVDGLGERNGRESPETLGAVATQYTPGALPHEPRATTAPMIPTVEPLPASAPIPELEDDAVDQGWEVGTTNNETSGVMVGDDAVLEASLGLGPPPAPAGENVQRDPALTALLSAIRKDIDG